MTHSVFLFKENDINKLIKNQKKEKSKVRILFTSQWDEISIDLTEKIIDRDEDAETIHMVDTWNNPHAVLIFKTFKLPALVTLNADKVTVEDYPSRIYQELKLDD